MLFYTSDMHFCDEKIRHVCSRPFENTDIMNQTIIQKWNSKVRVTDTVYILGDIFPCDGGDFGTISNIVKRLNGDKILIIGNHDELHLTSIEKCGAFKTLEHIALIQDAGKEIMLCHYPMMDWQNEHLGSFHLYGHIHNKDLPQIANYYKDKSAFNVGQDVWSFEPVTLAEILGGTQCI